MKAEASDDGAAIQAAKEREYKRLVNMRLKQRVETAAIAIFAGMLANQAWTGSIAEQQRAVDAARKLVDRIDNEFGPDF